MGYVALHNGLLVPTELKSAGSVGLADAGALSLIFGYGPTASGSLVDPISALRVPAVLASVKIISESIARLPLKLYRHLPDGGKEEAKDHPLYDLLNAAPNTFTTSVEWRLSMQSALSAWGNSYSFINRDGAGNVDELLFLHPNQVAVEVDLNTQEPLYRVTDLSGSQDVYTQRDVFHLRTFGVGQLGGYVGTSPIMQAREAIGLAMQLEEHAARLFSNSAKPAGVLSCPKVVSDKCWLDSRKARRTTIQVGLTRARQ